MKEITKTQLKLIINRMTKKTYDKIEILYKNEILFKNADESQCRAIQALVAEHKINHADIIIREYSSKVPYECRYQELHISETGYITEKFVSNIYSLNGYFTMKVLGANRNR